ncbi:MAG: UDP-glucose 4-epimerase [Verrucomicrobiales bacterium]|nr:UDP-glucose 4-epimerase [Verrucomicrobiales bacterium]
MKVLITGGFGFIGSHIAEALARQGAAIVILDNLSSGHPENLAWKNAAHQLELVEGNVGDRRLLRKIVPGCDWIFHQASVPSVPLSVSKPLETNADNLDGTLELLVASRDAKVSRFIFASSSSIYGEGAEEIKSENLPPNPLSPYAVQKYGAEKYCQLFHQLYGLNTVALRYFNVFGPRQSFDSAYSGVIARFCTQMLKGERPTIFGDGEQTRDFVFVDNVVSANLLAVQRPIEQIAGKVFNVAGGQSVSLLDLHQEINRLTGQNLEVRFEPARQGDVRSSRADIQSAQSLLGYEVLVPWQEGLRRTLEFYRNT